jgi:hypothetical protein
MKKKLLLVCFQNYYVLEDYKYDLEKLTNEFDISVCVSNFKLNNQKKKELEYFCKQNKIQKLMVIPYYSSSKGGERSLISIIFTHLYLILLRVKINFKNFQYCLSDNKLFIWQKIINERLLSQKCLKIGIANDPILLPTQKIKDLLKGDDIVQIVKSVHKLREVIPLIKKENKKIGKKISNTIRRYLDLYLDRTFLSYIFYGRSFNYEKYDFNCNGETKKFDLKLTFYYSAYVFWKKWYNEKNSVHLLKHKNNCNCKKNIKKKVVFLSSGPLLTLPANISEEKISKIKTQSINVAKFVNNLVKKNPEIDELSLKHHPRALEFNKNLFNETIFKNLDSKIKISHINSNELITDISCKYAIAFGVMSGALQKFKSSCNEIEVFCLKSLSKERFGEEYFLKLLNEDIIFFDDDNNEADKNYLEYLKNVEKKDKEFFSDFITNI